MKKKDLIKMLEKVPDDANLKIGSCTNDLFLGSRISYKEIQGFYKLSNIDFVLTDVDVIPRTL